MATAQVRKHRRSRYVLHGVDWRMYTRLLKIFVERPSIRLAFDRGELEIMSPLPEHESDADMLGRFVVVLTEERGLPLRCGRSTTYRRKRKQRGIEPDNSYWVTNEPRVRGKRRLNLRVDPPPDLCMEIDVTGSSINRMGIYAALRVPDVWRVDDEVLTFHVLQETGDYVRRETSLLFPDVRPADLMRVLELRSSLDDNGVVREFRAWVRNTLRTDPPAQD
jgi:Uma2 family endonuclease